MSRTAARHGRIARDAQTGGDAALAEPQAPAGPVMIGDLGEERASDEALRASEQRTARS